MTHELGSWVPYELNSRNFVRRFPNAYQAETKDIFPMGLNNGATIMIERKVIYGDHGPSFNIDNQAKYL